MSTFTAYLSKEYRDHRAGLFGLLVMIFVFGLICCVSLETHWIESRLVIWLTLGTLVTTVVLFAPDLAEQRQNTLAFMQRMPAGLRMAFASKLTFLTMVTLGATAFAFGIASVLRMGFASAPWVNPFATLGSLEWLILGSTLGCALWIFAISWWLPRSVLTVPATALVLGLVALPSVWLLSDKPGLANSLPLQTILIANPVLALVAAWVSLVLGRSHGRGPMPAAIRGLAVAGVGCAGLTGVTSSLVAEWNHLDPASLQIHSIQVGRSGQYAYLSGMRTTRRSPNGLTSLTPHQSGWPSFAISVDLRSGQLRQHGNPSVPCMFSPLSGQAFMGSGIVSESSLIALHIGDGMGVLQTLDTGTGAMVGQTHERAPFRGIENRCRKAIRETTRQRLPDGRRFWVFDGDIETDAEEGVRTLLSKRAQRWPFTPNRTVGLGYTGARRTSSGMMEVVAYDVVRELLTPYDSQWESLWILPEAWLVAKRSNANWQWFDPIQKQARPARCLRDGDRVEFLFSDGSLLVQHVPAHQPGTGKPRQSTLYRVHPATGEREVLGLDRSGALARAGTTNRTGVVGFGNLQELDNGRLICAVYGPFAAITSLDRDAGGFSPPIPCNVFGGVLGNEMVVFTDDSGRLMRGNVTTGAVAPVPFGNTSADEKR